MHALEEAWRVLRPDGLLVDLRPSIVHRLVGVRRSGRTRRVGRMNEWFGDDVAANRAVAEILRRKRFRQVRRDRFDCTRTMDRFADFRRWLDHYVTTGKLPSHDWLVEKLARALRGGGARTVVSGPLDLRVLVKVGRGGGR